jgi:hypothetical protein
MEDLPKWNPEMCSPLASKGIYTNVYRIEPVEDEIYTLEGVRANLPFGSSEGGWGGGGGSWTDQHGTPIGANIVYYSGHDDTFYRLDVKFDVELMKKLVKEVHYQDESTIYDEDQERSGGGVRDGFDALTFGFAPQGMVVVWAGYGISCIEVGRFQAHPIKDDKKYERLFDNWARKRNEIAKDMSMPNATCAQWDNYRRRFKIKLEVTSENKKFKLFYQRLDFYNGELMMYFRPEILQPAFVDRALPESMVIDWETDYKECYRGLVFLNEEKLLEKFKTIPEGSAHHFNVKISEDNEDMELFIDNEKIEVDSMRIWPLNRPGEYRESYKENEK